MTTQSNKSNYKPTEKGYQVILRDCETYGASTNPDPLSGSVLHLTLKKKWFDMILSGEKKEEYREIKPYWTKRLTHNSYINWLKPELDKLPNHVVEKLEDRNILYKHFRKVVFVNGYGDDKPAIIVELKSIIIGTGQSKWGGDENEYYYVLELGDVIYTKNIN